MKRLLILAVALPAFAQFANQRPPAAAAISLDQPHLSFDLILRLEKDFDDKMGNLGGKQPLDVVGPTRGVYLPGYGMVLTAEVDLIPTPGSLFNRTPAAEDRAQIHARKLQQLPVLEQLMRNMMMSSAQKLDIMPENERVVLAVRLWYRQWEDVSGLPQQVVMSADRKSAIAGQIKEETSR